MPVEENERARRHALLARHYAAENRHEIEKIMDTFAPDATMIYNRQVYQGVDAIALAHAYFGFSNQGAFAHPTNTIDRESISDRDIIVEGTFRGKHIGEFLGFAPTEREVELPFVAIYEFDHAGKLISERVVMNIAPLGAPA